MIYHNILRGLVQSPCHCVENLMPLTSYIILYDMGGGGIGSVTVETPSLKCCDVKGRDEPPNTIAYMLMYRYADVCAHHLKETMHC